MKLQIELSDESRAALNRKPPTMKRLTAIMNGNDEKDMPESWEARWLAARALESNGYDLK